MMNKDNSMENDMKLLKNQLVRREDVEFHYMKFEDTPSKLPMSVMKIRDTVLSQEEMEYYSLRTTPLLSLFGLYVHFPSQLMIVCCIGKTSMALNRCDEFELQDVIVRSGRNEMFKKGQCIKGVHYIEEVVELDISGRLDGGFDDGMLGLDIDIGEIRSQDLIADKERHWDYLINTNEENYQKWDDSRIVPLLPVYLGYRRIKNGGNYHDNIETINFGDIRYKKRLRDIKSNPRFEFVLFQNRNRSYEKVENEEFDYTKQRVKVLPNDIVNKAVNKALTYCVKRGKFEKRITRYLKKNSNSNTLNFTRMEESEPEPESESESESKSKPECYQILRGKKREALNAVLLSYGKLNKINKIN